MSRDYESVKLPPRHVITLSVAYQLYPEHINSPYRRKRGIRKPQRADRHEITITYIVEPYFDPRRRTRPASVLSVHGWPAHWNATQVPNVARAFKRATGLRPGYLAEIVREGLNSSGPSK